MTADNGFRDIILRRNNDGVRTECVRCGLVDRPDSPLAAFVEGSNQWVCLSCFAKHIGIPGADSLLAYLNSELHGTPAEMRERFLCNLDSAGGRTERLNRDASLDARVASLRHMAGELTGMADDLDRQISREYRCVMEKQYGAPRLSLVPAVDDPF